MYLTCPKKKYDPNKLSINRKKKKSEKIYKGKSTSSHILVRPLDSNRMNTLQSSITSENFKKCKSDNSGK